MKKNMNRRKFVGILGTAGVCAVGIGSGITACSSPKTTTVTTADEKGLDLLWDKSETADKIVVVSDLHFGIDDSFAQNVASKPKLVEFIDRLIVVGDVRELVIAGDFLDEWIIPLSYPSHNDSDAFYRQCIANNQEVFDALKKAIESGIKVVYVPGNHDMTLTEDVLAEELPGIVQARDAVGMGVHITGDRNEIAIEHCHRYDVYSAPDTVSNRALVSNDDTMLPPGYFYARLGTQWKFEGKPSNKVDYPIIDEAPDALDVDQTGAYLHYMIMTSLLLTQYTPDVGFDEKVFDVHIAGFDDSYSEYDMCPRMMEDGSISAPTLYKNFQRTWDERQVVNKVNSKLSFIEAVKGTGSTEYFRNQASKQYIDNPESDIEVVVFGHSHVPDFHDFGDGKYYVNDGTWIDTNLSADTELTRTFAVITTGATDTVTLYKYEIDGKVSDITAENTDA